MKKNFSGGFYIVDIDEVIDDGENHESCRRVDAELGADVAPMSSDGMDGDAQCVGNLFV